MFGLRPEPYRGHFRPTSTQERHRQRCWRRIRRPTHHRRMTERKERARHTPRRIVLVADDEPDARKMVSAILSERGYRVVAVRDGRAAVEAWSPGTFSWLVLDYRMPYLTGLDVVRHVRAHGDPTPALVMSGGRPDAIVVQFRGLHPIAFLEKPFSVGALRRVADRTLSSSLE